MAADRLSTGALEWALRQHKRRGDTDIFPIPFEIESIEANWREVRQFLEQEDIASYSTSAYRHTLMPKSSGCFRVAVQLDPIDSIVYSAILYETAPLLEAHRIAPELKIACSYRLDIQADGRVFTPSTGWDTYHARSRELAESSDHDHVLVADIADFYNQAYHHRIGNVLEAAGVDAIRAKNIEGYLGKFTAKQSRGLPVGPSPSILFAEACLDDVDKRLVSVGRPHVRYVDDFRIFCKSRLDAVSALQELTRYLYTAHRLTLQDSKTRIIEASHFVAHELHDPQEAERRGKLETVNDLIELIHYNTGYVVTEEELPKDDLAMAAIHNLEALLSASLDRNPVPLGVARYLLRRATTLRTSHVLARVLDHLPALGPVFREVCTYLQKVVPKGEAAQTTGARLLKFLREEDMGQLPFVRMWSLDLLARRPDFAGFDDAIQIANEARDELGLRPAALLARAHSNISWVRQHKEDWNSHKPWDCRAILWSSTVLPRAERQAWLDAAKGAKDLLVRSVALKALSLP